MRQKAMLIVGVFIGFILIIQLGGQLGLSVAQGTTGYFEQNIGAKTGDVEMDAVTQAVAEAFTPKANFNSTKAKLLLYRSATAPESLTVNLKLADVDHKPTGAALATGTIDCSAITEAVTGEVKEVTWGSAYDVVLGTEYVLEAYRATSTQGSIFVIYTDDGYSGQYALSTDTRSTWVPDATKDLYFGVYGTSSQMGLTGVMLNVSTWLLPIGGLMALFYLAFRRMRSKS